MIGKYLRPLCTLVLLALHTVHSGSALFIHPSNIRLFRPGNNNNAPIHSVFSKPFFHLFSPPTTAASTPPVSVNYNPKALNSPNLFSPGSDQLNTQSPLLQNFNRQNQPQQQPQPPFGFFQSNNFLRILPIIPEGSPGNDKNPKNSSPEETSAAEETKEMELDESTTKAPNNGTSARLRNSPRGRSPKKTKSKSVNPVQRGRSAKQITSNSSRNRGSTRKITNRDSNRSRSTQRRSNSKSQKQQATSARFRNHDVGYRTGQREIIRDDETDSNGADNGDNFGEEDEYQDGEEEPVDEEAESVYEEEEPADEEGTEDYDDSDPSGEENNEDNESSPRVRNQGFPSAENIQNAIQLLLRAANTVQRRQQSQNLRIQPRQKNRSTSTVQIEMVRPQII